MTTFVKSIMSPQSGKMWDELWECYKLVLFAINWKPSLAWDENILHKIMFSSIFMHNMIVEDE